MHVLVTVTSAKTISPTVTDVKGKEIHVLRVPPITDPNASLHKRNNVQSHIHGPITAHPRLWWFLHKILKLVALLHAQAVYAATPILLTLRNMSQDLFQTLVLPKQLFDFHFPSISCAGKPIKSNSKHSSGPPAYSVTFRRSPKIGMTPITQPTPVKAKAAAMM